MEAESHSGLPCLLVQSTMEPNWNAMHPGYLVEPDSARQAVKPFELHVQAGQDLSFRLCANPTVKSAGKRWGLHSQEEQRQWLERKGIESGFCVQQVTIHQLDVATGTIHRETWSHDLNLLAVRFDGMLQVVDALLLCAAVAHGIGSGKVFGFGLLSLARSVPR
jgi:CRISPR system Cascade subunit CasE